MNRLHNTPAGGTAGRRYSRFAAQLKQQFPDIVRLKEPLAGYTNYRVGGPADALVRPETLEQLQTIIQLCHRHRVPLFVLGKGANILVNDQGVPGIVVTLEGCCRQLRREGNYVYAGAGLQVSELVAFCEAEGLGGLDYMSGIPGTVGGALTMNAGAFVGEIGDRVVWVDAFTDAGERVRLSREEAGFGYRKAEGLKHKILLGCWLALEPVDSNQLIRSRMDYLKRRAEKQPLEYPSCGSVFKRPKGDFAGRLIELVGAKGLRHGGAMVSDKHANFILNVDNASARDIFGLIQEVQRRVYQATGVWLEPEVKLVGFSEAEVAEVLYPPADARPQQPAFAEKGKRNG